MTNTTNLSLTLLEQSQSQKEVTMNEALVRLDAVINRGVEDKDLNTPPGSPTAGDMYIVAASATGDWTGYEDRLAYYEQVWRFILPNEGMTIWVNDENRLYSYDGTVWVPASGITAHGSAGLSSGAVTVSESAVTANSRIFLTSEGSSTGVI
ncbi:MAG: DUF2793 domain-containing protein, partial [Hyphomicrobiales bacterium]|nr:DUF2793 domain-containing protein [Hyphomicrobiales bacterium]